MSSDGAARRNDALAISGGVPVRTKPMPPRFALGAEEEPAAEEPADEEFAWGSATGLDEAWAIKNDPLIRTTTDKNCLFMNRPTDCNRLFLWMPNRHPRISLFYLCGGSRGEKAAICRESRSTGALEERLSALGSRL